MAVPFDYSGPITILVDGVRLIAQALIIGGLAFQVLIARRLAGVLGRDGDRLIGRLRFLLLTVALVFTALTLADLAVRLGIAAHALDVAPRDLLDTPYASAGLALAAIGVATALLCLLRVDQHQPLVSVILIGAISLVGPLVNHGALGTSLPTPLMVLVALHQIGIGLWIGRLPFLTTAYAVCRDGLAQDRLARGSAPLGALGITLTVVGGLGATAFVYALDGQPPDLSVVTPFGVKLAEKLLLTVVILLIGLATGRLARHLATDAAITVMPLRRALTVSFGLGATLILLSAGIGQQLPTGDDAAAARAGTPTAEIATALAPTLPDLRAPDDRGGTITVPRSHPTGDRLEDVQAAWNLFTRQWVGVLVLTLATLIGLDRARLFGLAGLWPWLLVGLAGFLVHQSPEGWTPILSLLGAAGVPLAGLVPPGPAAAPGLDGSVWPDGTTVSAGLVLLIGLAEAAGRAAMIGPRTAGTLSLVGLAGGASLVLAGIVGTDAIADPTRLIARDPAALLLLAAGWCRWIDAVTGTDGRRGAGAVAARAAWPLLLAAVGTVLLVVPDA